MSSWLDNLAAHVEEEDEEDYESQPQIKPPQPQQKPQSPVNQESKPQEPQSNQPDVKEESNNIQHSTEKKEENQNQSEVTPKKEDEIIGENSKDEKNKSNTPYTGTITKEMHTFDKSLTALHKRQEFLYASAMIKTRSSVDFALERTSKPIQTIGGLGTVSLEAKGKYDKVQKHIMSIKPLCSVAPKSK